MSFHDLPDDWSDRPLSEPRLVADVLDLIVKESDRHAGALAVLMCDSEGRLVQPVVIGELEPEVSDADRDRMFGVFLGVMDGEGSLLIAIARSDGLSITAEDVAWRRAADRAGAAGVRILGVHVITLAGSREVPAVGEAA